MSAAVADKLAEARKLIERGWTRGSFRQGSRFCALGAVRQVTTENGLTKKNFAVRIDCYDALSQAIGTSIGWPSDIANWNDEQKSKKPVTEAFRKAEELARQS